MSGLLSFKFHKWLVLCWVILTSNSIATENCHVINSTIELLLISYHTNHCCSSKVSQMGRTAGCLPLLVVSIATSSFLKAGPQRGSFQISSTLEPPGFVSKFIVTLPEGTYLQPLGDKQWLQSKNLLLRETVVHFCFLLSIDKFQTNKIKSINKRVHHYITS